VESLSLCLPEMKAPSDPSGFVQFFLGYGSHPLSRSISKVQSMLSRANYDAGDLAEPLRLDPTLAARVQSVANTALFSRQQRAAIHLSRTCGSLRKVGSALCRDKIPAAAGRNTGGMFAGGLMVRRARMNRKIVTYWGRRTRRSAGNKSSANWRSPWSAIPNPKALPRTWMR
jgi:hypothetical protein